MKKHALTLALGAAAALFASTNAMAQYTIKVGGASIDPGASASGATGGPLNGTQLSLDVKSQSTLFFSVVRTVNDQWDVELALGLPPMHDVTLKVLNFAPFQSYAGQKIGTVRQIAPTLFANYKFGDAQSALRPFVGLGVNYTTFDQAESTPLYDSLSGGKHVTSKLTDSWGLAAQVGATYKLGGAWSVTGAWSTADVKTVLTATTGIGDLKTDIKFNPSVLTLAVGYSF